MFKATLEPLPTLRAIPFGLVDWAWPMEAGPYQPTKRPSPATCGEQLCIVFIENHDH